MVMAVGGAESGCLQAEHGALSLVSPSRLLFPCCKDGGDCGPESDRGRGQTSYSESCDAPPRLRYRGDAAPQLPGISMVVTHSLSSGASTSPGKALDCPSYCHFQEVADPGIRVPILFLTWDTQALGLLKASGEDSVTPALGVSFSHSSTMSYSLPHRQENVLRSPQQNCCLQLSHQGTQTKWLSRRVGGRLPREGLYGTCS